MVQLQKSMRRLPHPCHDHYHCEEWPVVSRRTKQTETVFLLLLLHFRKLGQQYQKALSPRLMNRDPISERISKIHTLGMSVLQPSMLSDFCGLLGPVPMSRLDSTHNGYFYVIYLQNERGRFQQEVRNKRARYPSVASHGSLRVLLVHVVSGKWSFHGESRRPGMWLMCCRSCGNRRHESGDSSAHNLDLGSSNERITC
jgi:hypothetical protein